MSLSVIIPSRNIDNLVACVRAVRKCEPNVRIIVVDDGVMVPIEPNVCVTLLEVSVVQGVKPFIFSRNVNLGIKAAGSDDVILLNDDALLRTPGGFSLMQSEAAARPEYGVISATTNCCANPNQNPQGIGLRDEPGSVAFVCVFIPRRTLDKVELLDERFTGYGYDDDDYCHRVRLAGLKIGIHDGCFVNHSELKPTFRGRPEWKADLEVALKIFEAKWGHAPDEIPERVSA